MERYTLLKNWVNKAIVDNPGIISESSNSGEVYYALYEIWIEDCQKALKETINGVAPDIVNKATKEPTPS